VRPLGPSGRCQHVPVARSADELLVRRFYVDAWNRWDDAIVDVLLAEDFTFRGSLGDEVVGRDGWRTYRDMIRAAAPDFHNEIIDVVASPGRVAARLRYRGHHRGGLLGYAGRDQLFEYSGAAFFWCTDEHLRSAWVLGDIDALRRQIRT
jgi:steroid delta-isomerase-like uncharacterized protein